MSIRVALHHRTRYDYDRPVSLSPQVIRLRPAAHCRTPILAYSLKISPRPHFLNWQQDPFGNWQARVVFPDKVKFFEIETDLIAEMTVINPFDFFVESYAENLPFEYDTILRKDLEPYLKIEEDGPLLRQWLASHEAPSGNTVSWLVNLNRRLQQDIAYLIRMEPGVQTCEETLSKRSGSCRDSGWLLVQILRHYGLAARFVSGYLIQLKPDVPSLDGPSGADHDFTDLHAWCEVYVPGAGWLGLDPTSGLFAGEGHLPLACTSEPASAAPVTGFTEKCDSRFSFHMDVTRVHEDPRVTKPYTEEEWNAILATGYQLDEKLRQLDLRLTMGGEPTFVGIDYPDAPEWNTEALGEHKLRLSEDLIRRLKQRFAPGGVLHFGQGKWYPGEELPRWALSAFWRTDGAPLWHDDRLLADHRSSANFSIRHAEAFIKTLAEYLGVNTEHTLPAYEDVVYYLWKERQLPPEVDPLKYDLKDPLERKRLGRLLEQGLGEIVGYVLPMMYDPVAGSWFSGLWQTGRERLFLIPGDSPMGYRLPLTSLQGQIAQQSLRDPFEKKPPLPVFQVQHGRRRLEVLTHDGATPQETSWLQSATLGTALCVDPRNGVLHIFIPPTWYTEGWVKLIAAIEATASELKIPVVLEGYEPPQDSRLRALKVTPDPGVIEVNIHPGSNWGELVQNTTILYEEARLSRLTTEKFMLDGRHTGTGGGNHITVGAATPEDSPFLRRPDLLRSLLLYFQHHPGLSYLFSGLFIGPTSQAPRIDEARHESLYELEIALNQFTPGMHLQPWLVDRLLRNILTDVTGNTHRTEISIDKLYAPGSYHGRQGLIEFRGFEMPPHSRMSLAQQLFLRALLARLWETPYTGSPVRWGTSLHDRFMLPHYVWQDFLEVLDDLNEHGYRLQPKWFAPFFEFRFPHYGEVQVGDVKIELRMALEPWHVLGEEVISGGTARAVDSAVERLQVKATGLTPEKYILTCNERYVPLQPTGTKEEAVAGVRFKAWAPYFTLHPHLPVQTPLVFDLVNKFTGKSLGGCLYHVAHPAGRNYETFPVNAYEAEARRVARFSTLGYTPGKISLPPEETNPDYPHTLDLRR